MPCAAFAKSRPEPIGQTTASGGVPAELLDDLVGERLRALGRVRLDVAFEERPREQLGELPLEVWHASNEQSRPTRCAPYTSDDTSGASAGARITDSSPTRRGLGRDGVAEVPGRGAADRLQPELRRRGSGDRCDPVLEGLRRVGRLELQPQLDAQQARQPVGVDQRRPARPAEPRPSGWTGRSGAYRQSGGRAGGDLVAGDGPADDVPVVGDVERTVAAVALFGEP